MKAVDSYEDRLKMVEMHDDVIKRITDSLKKKHAVEACWLIYACFESRIVRTLEKVSQGCMERKCFQNHRVGIDTRIDCLKRLMRQKYPCLDEFNVNTLGQTKAWCRERNKLVHALLTLDRYEGADKKFLDLAKNGAPIAEKLYDEVTVFRNAYYKLHDIPPFPEKVTSTCRLLKKKENE